MIELYRAMIPANHIINDNHGQHYRIHQGNLTWIKNQFNRIFEKLEETPGNFKMPNIEDVLPHLGETISIRCEVLRCTNTLFDPHNYAKTFKTPIDLLVKNGYIKDDNWKYINGITYSGGGGNVWKSRAVRLENDGLPDEITPDWWQQYTDNYGDILIRVLIE